MTQNPKTGRGLLLETPAQATRAADLVKTALGGSRTSETARAVQNLEVVRRGRGGPTATSTPALGKDTALDAPSQVTLIAAEQRSGRSQGATIVKSPEALGRLVRQAREAMGLSQGAFADLAGVGRRFISELENGKPTLELGKVMTVCAAAGLDLMAASR